MEDSSYQKSNRRGVWIFAAILFLTCCILSTGAIVSFGGAAFLMKRSNDGSTATAAVDATSTSIKKAQIATLTASTAATNVFKFNLADAFDSNQNGWNVGKTNDAFWTGESNIKDGVYSWNIQEFKKGFLNYSDFSKSPMLEDFDVSVDAKIANGTDATCSGIIFRKSPQGWESGGYAISVCKSRQFFAGYVERGKWLATSGWVTSTSIKKNDWNHIEVDARGSHLIFKINDFIVYEMNDTHRADGNIALFIEVHEGNKDSGANVVFVDPQNTGGMTLLFDNFKLQGR